MRQRFRSAIPTLGWFLGIGIVVAVGALAYVHTTALEDVDRQLTRDHEVMDSLDAMLIAMNEATAARRGFALTGDEAQLLSYRHALERLARARVTIRDATKDDLVQQRRIRELDPLIIARLAQLDAAVRARRERGFDADREGAFTADGDVRSERARSLVEDMQAEARRLLDERQLAARADSAQVKRTMIGGFGASVAVLLVALLALRREIGRRRRTEEALAERERRLATTLNSIGDGVIATASDGAIVHMNPVAEQLTGWSADDAAGRRFTEVFAIVDERSRAPALDPVTEVLARRAPVELASPVTLVAKGGTEHPIADSAAPILDHDGKLQGAVVVFRDVSHARAVEERFRRLLEAAPDAILITDAEGRIAIANAQATVLFGYAADELVGKPLELLVPERLRERYQAERRRFGAAPAVKQLGADFSLFARDKDGRERPVEVSLSPLATPDGPLVIAAVRDVSKRRELERFRDEYVGYISHDLKNPLSVIALQARLLTRQLDGRDMVEEERAVDVIASSAVLIDRLVRELLEMAYLESDQVELQKEPAELASFLKTVLQRTISTPDRPRVRLEIRDTATACVDAGRIERVIVNFIQNALKYAPIDSPIVVRVEARADQAVISVADRGPGVAPAERAVVFDKYRRSAAARSKEGLGLGLYISRKIVEAHGGAIGVEDTPGGGATFYFAIPRLCKEEAVPLRIALEATPANGSGSRLQGRNVLLVDDEVQAVKALTELLGMEGLVVSAATSGEQALALAEARRPDVAVVDVQMPGMSGLALLERLRARFPGLPAVIMSGFMPHLEDIAETQGATGAAYVGKPVDVDELLRTLDRMLAPGAEVAAARRRDATLQA